MSLIVWDSAYGRKLRAGRPAQRDGTGGRKDPTHERDPYDEEAAEKCVGSAAGDILPADRQRYFELVLLERQVEA